MRIRVENTTGHPRDTKVIFVSDDGVEIDISRKIPASTKIVFTQDGVHSIPKINLTMNVDEFNLQVDRAVSE